LLGEQHGLHSGCGKRRKSADEAGEYADSQHGANRPALHGCDEDKSNEETGEHVDRQRRQGEIAAINRLDEICHGKARPTAKNAAFCNRYICPHANCPLIAEGKDEREGVNVARASIIQAAGAKAPRAKTQQIS
jgi:hypothetical protein